jgi:hypothetical protein
MNENKWMNGNEWMNVFHAAIQSFPIAMSGYEFITEN